MSFIEKMERADRAKRNTEAPKSLLSRLKKGAAKRVAIGAALVTTAAAGWGLASHFQSEDNERAASIEYRVQSANLHLDDSAFDVTKPLNLTGMNPAALGEYSYFSSKCASYLRVLNNDMENNLKDRNAGTIDPASRLKTMYAQLDQEIQATGDKVLSFGGTDKNAAIQYQLLGKVKAQLQILEPQIKSGKSRAERFDVVQGLSQMASQKAQIATNARFNQAAGVRRGETYDF